MTIELLKILFGEQELHHAKPLPEDHYLIKSFGKKKLQLFNYFELWDLFWTYTYVTLDVYNTQDFPKLYLRTFVSGKIIDIVMELMH